MSSNPDLSSVLRTLSAFAKPASNPPAHNLPRPHQHQPQAQPAQPKPHERKPPGQLPSPSTDPSRITTWPSALKHIMHLISTNASFSAHIQHLIKSQREHERQWWAGREALIAKQRTREEKRRRVEEVLKSVGAPVAASSDSPSTEGNSQDSKEMIIKENTTELRIYDTKVYQASVDMSRSMETELRKLGVPFFCLASATAASLKREREEKGKEGALSKEELDVLKKRVLDLLVDLTM